VTQHEFEPLVTIVCHHLQSFPVPNVIEQVNNLYGLMYVVTKYGQLYVCDLESAACLSSVTVSSEIIFLTAVGSLTQGIICLNTAGQVCYCNSIS